MEDCLHEAFRDSVTLAGNYFLYSATVMLIDNFSTFFLYLYASSAVCFMYCLWRWQIVDLQNKITLHRMCRKATLHYRAITPLCSSPVILRNFTMLHVISNHETERGEVLDSTKIAASRSKWQARASRTIVKCSPQEFEACHKTVAEVTWELAPGTFLIDWPMCRIRQHRPASQLIGPDGKTMLQHGVITARGWLRFTVLTCT